MAYTKQKTATRIAVSLLMALAILITFTFAGCEWTSLLPAQTQQTTVPNQTNNLGWEGTSSSTAVVIPEFFHTLTGLGCSESEILVRPVSVCLGNTSYALPQCGISSADILIEIPVESGISRLMMITTNYADIEQIGSVRATRESLAKIADAFDAIQFYAGTADEGTSVSLPYDTLDFLRQNLSNVYYRDPSRYAPHNLMTNGTLMTQGIEGLRYRTSIKDDFSLPYLFADYNETITPIGSSANSIKLTYSSIQQANFTYDESTDTYLRYQLGEQHIDGITEQQLSFSNLFFLSANTVTHETSQGATMDITIEDGGSGFLCYGGIAQEIKWTYSDGELLFYTASGDPLTVNRGNAYIGFYKSSQANSLSIQ